MRLPFVQLAQDAYERAAELGAALGIDEVAALGHLSLLYRWLLTTGSDTEAPHGIARGRLAVAQIEGGCRWRGERGVMARALVDLGLVEELPEGLRVRGADRYSAAWAKKERDRASAEAGRQARANQSRVAESRDDVVATTPRRRDDVEKTSGRQTQTQTQTQVEASPPPGDPPKKAPDRPPPAPGEAFFAWFQDLRAERLGEVRERPPKAGVSSWAARAWQEVGGDVERLKAGALAYLADEHWLKAKPRCPWNGWVAQWEQQVPPRAPTSPPAPAEGPLEAAWSTRLQRLRDDGNAYAAAKLAQLRPVRLDGAELVVASGDKFFADFVRETWSAVLPGVRIEAAP